MVQKDQLYWKSQIKKLEDYCDKNGLRVVFRDVEIDLVYFDKKLIILTNRKNLEKTTHHFLHELGHVLLMNNKMEYKERYGYIENEFSRSSLTSRISILQEELDAWKQGLMLSKNLDIDINRRKWELHKTKCISGYLGWIECFKNNKRKRNGRN